MIVDFLGKEIRVGDLVVWPGRKGSSLWMNSGKVIALETVEDNWTGEESIKLTALNKNDRPVILTELNRVVVVC